MGDSLARADGSVAIAQTKEGFGTNEIVRANEMATVALAARAKAEIEARYIVAMKNPRDLDTVRIKLLKECARPGFAAVARYRKPVGKKDGKEQFIEGPSIRFAEAAIRYMGNIAAEPSVTWDDDQRRGVRVTVTDIESNVSYSTDFVVPKTVERKFLKKGQQPLGSRTNSYGDLVYIVQATDDEVAMKVAALVSKALRTQGLRLLPGDILEECMDKVVDVQESEVKDDPDAAKKRLLDAFAKLNIMPTHLSAYLGHDIATISPKELVDLRAVYSAIADGETTWAELAAGGQSDDNEQPTAAQKAVEAVKAKIAAKQKPANNQKQQQVIETTGTSKLLFDAKYTRELVGQPFEKGNESQRSKYIYAIEQSIADLADDAQISAANSLLESLRREHDDLRAEGA
jgi:hypothetical protein